MEVRRRRRWEKKRKNVSTPADIERLKPAAHVMPESAAAIVPEVSAALQRRAPEEAPVSVQTLPTVEDLIRTISTGISSIQTEVQETRILNERLVFTLKEASRSGFSVAFL